MLRSRYAYLVADSEAPVCVASVSGGRRTAGIPAIIRRLNPEIVRFSSGGRDLDDGHPYGRQIKDRLDEEFGEPVVESRLYQALNALDDLGLVRKRHGTADARTKCYTLTDDACRLLEAHTQRCATVVGLDVRRAANP